MPARDRGRTRDQKRRQVCAFSCLRPYSQIKDGSPRVVHFKKGLRCIRYVPWLKGVIKRVGYRRFSHSPHSHLKDTSYRCSVAVIVLNRASGPLTPNASSAATGEVPFAHFVWYRTGTCERH